MAYHKYGLLTLESKAEGCKRKEIALRFRDEQFISFVLYPYKSIEASSIIFLIYILVLGVNTEKCDVTLPW